MDFNSFKNQSRLIEIYNELRRSQQVSVKIDFDQVLYLVVADLIEKRNSPTNQVRDSFDVVLRYYLDAEEFQKYVIEKQPLNN